MPKYQVIKDIKVIDFVLLKVGDDIELNEGEPLKMNTPFGFLELSFESIQSSLKEKSYLLLAISYKLSKIQNSITSEVILFDGISILNEDDIIPNREDRLNILLN